MNLKNYDWIGLVAVILIIGSVTAMANYYYFEEKSECISNPLVYAAQQYEEKFGYPFEGSGSFIVGVNQRSPRFWFNSHNVSMEKLSPTHSNNSYMFEINETLFNNAFDP